MTQGTMSNGAGPYNKIINTLHWSSYTVEIYEVKMELVGTKARSSPAPQDKKETRSDPLVLGYNKT